MPNGDVFLANSALKLQIPRRFCHRPELSNASYRPISCDKIMRGKIILICRKVVSYDFTLHDFVTVYFQKENCCYQREAGRFSNELLRL